MDFWIDTVSTCNALYADKCWAVLTWVQVVCAKLKTFIHDILRSQSRDWRTQNRKAAEATAGVQT